MEVEVGGAAVARPRVAAICALYDEVFSVPPFFWRPDEPELHRERLLRLLDDPTFGVALAREGDELAGFAYGCTVPPDTRRWSGLVHAVPPEVTREWPGRTFLLFDYAVRSSRRGLGIGRRLHDELLASRPEERATLTVQPTAVDTKALYERWGWWRVGEVAGGPSAAAPVFDVYLLDRLPSPRHATP